MNFKEYLLSRCKQFAKFVNRNQVFLDVDSELLTFPLYNKYLKLSGILRYNWKGVKKDNTMYMPVGTGVWGLDTVDTRSDWLLVVEGVFDAMVLQSYGFSAVALLNNNGKRQIHWLEKMFPHMNILAVCDGDDAGLGMCKYVKHWVQCLPDTDPANMEQELLVDLIEGYVNAQRT